MPESTARELFAHVTRLFARARSQLVRSSCARGLRRVIGSNEVQIDTVEQLRSCGQPSCEPRKQDTCRRTHVISAAANVNTNGFRPVGTKHDIRLRFR